MHKRFVNTNGTSNGKMFWIRALAKRVYKIKSDPPSLPRSFVSEGTWPAMTRFFPEGRREKTLGTSSRLGQSLKTDRSLLPLVVRLQ